MPKIFKAEDFISGTLHKKGKKKERKRIIS